MTKLTAERLAEIKEFLDPEDCDYDPNFEERAIKFIRELLSHIDHLTTIEDAEVIEQVHRLTSRDWVYSGPQPDRCRAIADRIRIE